MKSASAPRFAHPSLPFGMREKELTFHDRETLSSNMSQQGGASGSGTSVFVVVTVSEPVICCDSGVRGTVTIYEGIKSDPSTWVEQKNKIVTIELEGSTKGPVSGEGHAFLDYIPQGVEDCGKFIHFLGHGPPNYSAAVKSERVGIIKKRSWLRYSVSSTSRAMLVLLHPPATATAKQSFARKRVPKPGVWERGEKYFRL